ncbi:hypothetical protein [Nonomuraea lactucae]|uniref:hypothetical protein n=1 Tax=Nonomuraea lactucae TaxID=2249762 RepID=UPI000DE38AFD|nr:hypothetical protein [Nonomuraea lactucae]
MTRKYAAILAGMAVAAAMTNGLAATSAHAATSADGYKAQLRSADGYCMVPRGRDLKVLPCKPNHWLWYVGKVNTTVKGFGASKPLMFRYADPRTVSSEGWWCIDSDAKENAYMSLCSANDRGQLWLPMGADNLPYRPLASVQKLDEANGNGMEALLDALTLKHNNSKVHIKLCCEPPRSDRNNWRWW